MITWAEEDVRTKEWKCALSALKDKDGHLKPNGTCFKSPIKHAEAAHCFIVLDGNVLAFADQSMPIITTTEKRYLIQAEGEDKRRYTLKDERENSTALDSQFVIEHDFNLSQNETLDAYLEKYSNELSRDDRYKLATELCLLIDKLNEQQWGYTDIHSSNIFIDKNRKPYLSDLKLVKFNEQGIREEGTYSPAAESDDYPAETINTLAISNLLLSVLDNLSLDSHQENNLNAILSPAEIAEERIPLDCYLETCFESPEEEMCMPALSLASVLTCIRYGIQIREDLSRKTINMMTFLAEKLPIKAEYLQPNMLSMIDALMQNNIEMREALFVKDNVEIIQKLLLMNNIQLTNRMFDPEVLIALKQLDALSRVTNQHDQVPMPLRNCVSLRAGGVLIGEGYFHHKNIDKISENPKDIIEISKQAILKNQYNQLLLQKINGLTSFEGLETLGKVLIEKAEKYFLCELWEDKAGRIAAQNDFADTLKSIQTKVKTQYQTPWGKKAMVLMGNIVLLASIVGILYNKIVRNTFFLSAERPEEKMTKEVGSLSNRLVLKT